MSNAAIKSFPVAAGAYRESNPKSFLTHACTVDANGFPATVLCKRVKLESILDDSTQGTHDAPSCPVCVAKLAKLPS